MRSSDLAAQAFEISLETKATFYDSLFLAASEQEKVPLITLDRMMYQLAKAKYNVQML
jgi:predicted nucleic acid-binding protein